MRLVNTYTIPPALDYLKTLLEQTEIIDTPNYSASLTYRPHEKALYLQAKADRLRVEVSFWEGEANQRINMGLFLFQGKTTQQAFEGIPALEAYETLMRVFAEYGLGRKNP